LYNELFNASHVSLVLGKHNSIDTLIFQPFPVNYAKMPLSLSKLDHTICPDLLLVIEGQRYERTSLSLPLAPPRILFGRGSHWRHQSLTSFWVRLCLPFIFSQLKINVKHQ